MPLWVNEEIEFVKQYLRLPPVQIYELFRQEFPNSDRTYNSIQKKVLQLQEAFAPEESEEDLEEATFTPDPPHSPLIERRVSPAVKARYTIRAREWLEELVRFSDTVTRPPAADLVDEGGSTLVIQISDLHFGKHTPFYDLQVGKDRLLDMAPEVFRRVRGVEIDEILILLIGDLVEGEDIFSNQATKLICSVIQQTEACTEGIWHMALTLEQLYPGVPIRVEHVPGNHGRMSHTASDATNWDNVICNNLYVLSGITDTVITVVKNYDKFKKFKVKDKVGLIYHEGVKHTGTPATQRKIAGWVHGKHVDFICHGHYHEWGIGGWMDVPVIKNGCLCGPDDLAEKMGNEGTARQGYFLVTPGKPLWGFGFAEWPHPIDE
jgi:calcineurin-like phosphoesterase family protein